MISTEQLKQILTEQKQAITARPLGTLRNELSSVPKLKKLPHVVVITGLRRTGKSTFLRQIINKYYSQDKCYFINFEDERLYNFSAENFNIIYETLVELFGEQKTFFIDEIQNVKNFQSFVRRFYDMGFKFYITGSNANLLSKEIGTRLTGRHIDLNIQPFSFREFLKFKNIEFSDSSFYKSETKAEIKRAFNDYFTNGGMPEFLQYNDKEILLRIYDDIVIKDVAVRHGISNLFEMRAMYRYLVTSFANRFSFNKLQKVTGLGSVNTIRNYISYLVDTFFVTVINKFDYSYKKQLANEKKLYVIDNGFIPLISTKVTKDFGWMLENIVFNELNKKYNVFYFIHNKIECDFVVGNMNKVIGLFQVCWEFNPDNKKREINGLLSALNFFDINEGKIFTQDQEDEIRIDNKVISITPVWKWLLTNDDL